MEIQTTAQGTHNQPKHRFVFLLAMLLLMWLCVPVLDTIVPKTQTEVIRRFVFGMLFILVLLAAVRAVSRQRRSVVVGWLLAVPAMLTELLSMRYHHTGVRVAIYLCTIAFLSFVIILVLAHLFSAERVTSDTICAALCVYLLMGVLWAAVYSLIAVRDPGAFSYNVADINASMHLGGEQNSIALYYSMVTMTTLGYGDVAPTKSLTRTLAAMQAMLGQIYLAVLVARLVGIHVAHSTIRKNPDAT